MTAGFKWADPEWKYSVGLMSRVSQGPSITNLGIHITHPSFIETCKVVVRYWRRTETNF